MQWQWYNETSWSSLLQVAPLTQGLLSQGKIWTESTKEVQVMNFKNWRVEDFVSKLHWVPSEYPLDLYWSSWMIDVIQCSYFLTSFPHNASFQKRELLHFAVKKNYNHQRPTPLHTPPPRCCHLSKGIMASIPRGLSCQEHPSGRPALLIMRPACQLSVSYYCQWSTSASAIPVNNDDDNDNHNNGRMRCVVC